MAKGTILTFLILTAIAMLLVGIQIGKRLERTDKENPLIPTVVKLTSPPESTTSARVISPTISASVSATISPPTGTYINQECGYTVVIPKGWIKNEYGGKSVGLADREASPSSKVAIICASEIPKPPLTEDKIEDTLLSGISAKLYHDSAPSDGSLLDEVIAKIPNKEMEIYIGGYGKGFSQVLSSFKFTQ